MSRKMKRIITVVMAIIILVTSVGSYKFDSEAASKLKNGTYTFAPGNCTKFVVKNKRITIKLKGSSFLINNDASTGKKAISMPVSKKCKYIAQEFDRTNGQQSKHKASYKKVKGWIKDCRAAKVRTGYPNTMGMVTIVVKNGKIVKVQYLFT